MASNRRIVPHLHIARIFQCARQIPNWKKQNTLIQDWTYNQMKPLPASTTLSSLDKQQVECEPFPAVEPHIQSERRWSRGVWVKQTEREVTQARCCRQRAMFGDMTRLSKPHLYEPPAPWAYQHSQRLLCPYHCTLSTQPGKCLMYLIVTYVNISSRAGLLELWWFVD